MYMCMYPGLHNLATFNGTTGTHTEIEKYSLHSVIVFLASWSSS